MKMANSRSRLEASRSLVDMLVCPKGQDHSAKLKVMSKLTMHPRCLTECHGHLGISLGGPKLQIRVSLDDIEGGKVNWAKPETC